MIRKSLIDAKPFSKALDQACKVLSRQSYPVLSEVLVQFIDGTCILTATDLNTRLSIRVPAQGEDLAFVLKRSKDVAKICRLFSGALHLELESSGNDDSRCLQLRMYCGDRTCEFDVIEPELYPLPSAFPITDKFSMNAATLLMRYERVRYALGPANIDTKATVCSVQLSGNHVFTLDGMHLACDTDGSFTFPRPFMIYGNSLSYLALFGDQNTLVELGDKHGCFTNGAITVEFRIPDCQCSNVDAAIPKSFEEEFEVSPKSFLQELKFLKGLSSETRPSVRFCGGEMVMCETNGKYSTTVPVQGHSGITFAFKLNDLMDVMRQFKDEPLVRVKVKSAVTPIVIQAEGRSDFALVCTTRLTDKLMAA